MPPEDETDTFTGGEPSDRGAIIRRGRDHEMDLIVGQRFEPLTQFALKAKRTARAPALESICCQNLRFG
jgi:hypothetical protein